MGKHGWWVVTSQGGVIQGVFGSALMQMAEECAKRVEVQTGFAAHVRHVGGERPSVGQVLS